MLSHNKAPIKIDTSLTQMAKSPNHGIAPLSKSHGSGSWPSTPQTPWSPTSPTSPSPSSEYSMQHTMRRKGYVPFKSLGSTLQGSIWKAKSPKSGNRSSVIKVTKKSLHSQKKTVISGIAVDIEEDIIKETAILRYLTSNKPPKSLARFEYFFSDKKNYFLVMEDGGSGFFEFVSQCHEFIATEKLSIAEWQRFIKMAFKQIVELIHWMHNTMNCVHLDLSLENFVISNVMVTINELDQVVFSDKFVIKLVDFGLAEVFTAKNMHDEISFLCKKYVGKTAYKAPKVHGKKRVFDARAADCWSLAVCLFMAIVGGSPYKRPTKSDPTFVYLVSGKIMDLLKEWDRTEFVTASMVDLMSRIFVKEKYRLNIDEIRKHPWFNL